MASRWLKIKPRAGRWGEANARWAGRSAPASDVAPPVLNNIAYEWGNHTAPGTNGVNLESATLGFVDPTSGGDLTFSVVSVTGTTPGTFWNHDVNIPAGSTPMLKAAGWRAATGVYVFTIQADNAGGSDTATITVTAVGDAANFGNSSSNWPEANFNATAASAYINGLRRLLLMPGWERGNNSVRMGSSFSFGGDVEFAYADPTNPPTLTVIQFGTGGDHIVIENLAFTGTPSAGVNGHVQLGGCTDCRVRFNTVGFGETIADYPGDDFSGVYITGASDTILVHQNHVQFRFRGVYLEGGTNLTVTDNWLDQCQGQGVYVGFNVDGAIIRENIISNPTRAPGDTVNHCDGIQVSDYDLLGGTNKKAQNLTVENNITWQGFGTTAISAFRGGGSAPSGPGVVSANTKVNWNIWLTWLASSLDYDSIGGASDTPQVIGNWCQRQLTGTESLDNPFGSNKDEFNEAAGMNINAGGAVNATGTLLLDDNVVDNDISYLSAFASGATTDGGNNVQYLRAANTDHVVGNPQTYVEDFTDAELRALTKADIKLHAMTAAARADLKGPVIDATTWRTTKLVSSITADTTSYTADTNTITADQT